MKWKFFCPLFLIGCSIFLGCREIKEPEFKRIERFGIKNWNLQEATIGFRVVYYNPNNFGVTVKEADVDVYADSVYLGKFVQDSTIAVAKNSDFSIPFSGAVSFKTAMSLNLETLPQREVLLKADGTVKVGKAGIFITQPIHYEGRHRLDEIKLQ